MGMKRKMMRSAVIGMRARSKHIEDAFDKETMKTWPKQRTEMYAHIVKEMYELSTDAERARWVMSYCEGIFNTGRNAWRKAKEEDDQKYEMRIADLEAELEAKKKPMVEIVGA